MLPGLLPPGMLPAPGIIPPGAPDPGIPPPGIPRPAPDFRPGCASATGPQIKAPASVASRQQARVIPPTLGFIAVLAGTLLNPFARADIRLLCWFKTAILCIANLKPTASPLCTSRASPPPRRASSHSTTSRSTSIRREIPLPSTRHATGLPSSVGRTPTRAAEVRNPRERAPPSRSAGRRSIPFQRTEFQPFSRLPSIHSRFDNPACRSIPPLSRTLTPAHPCRCHNRCNRPTSRGPAHAAAELSPGYPPASISPPGKSPSRNLAQLTLGHSRWSEATLSDPDSSLNWITPLTQPTHATRPRPATPLQPARWPSHSFCGSGT